MRQKRYQYRNKNGIEWTPWFEYDGPEDPVQLKCYGGKCLKNEYRTI